MTHYAKGCLYILGSILLWAFFPTISKLSLSELPPIISYCITVACAGGFFLLLVAKNNRWQELKDRRVLKDSFFAAIFISVLFYGLYFYGLQYTEAGSASIIALSEVLWTFLLFNVWKKEFIDGQKILGIILMLLAAILALSQNTVHLNIGEFIIFFGTAFAPFGNFYQKRARTYASSETILFLRSVFSVPLLLIISFAIGERIGGNISNNIILLLILNGFFLAGLSKIFWLEGITRISVTIAQGLHSFTPVLTLITAFLILSEIPNPYQVASLIPALIGIRLLFSEKKLKNV
ncbi:MAG TPA: DMT family transporter [Candidatus Paceibacterota bacterium]